MLAAVAAVPLFFNLDSARAFEPDKVVVLRCLAALVVAAWAVGVLERRDRREFRPWEAMKRPWVLLVALLVSVHLASTAFSIAPRISFWGSYERLQGTYSLLSCVALFAVIAATLRRRAQVERVVTAIVLASVPVGLYGVAQHFGLDPIPWAAGARAGVTSTLGSPNFAGAYLLMVVPLTLHRLVDSIRGRHALAGTAYLLALAAQGTVLVLSRSRAPVLALCGAGLVMALLLARSRRARLAWAGGGALVALLVVAVNLPGLRSFSEDETGSIHSRVLIWDAALRLTGPHPPLGIAGDEMSGEDRFHRLRPLLGYGPESMRAAFPRVRPPRIRAWDTSIDRAHNETLDRLVTTGWAGVVAFCVLVWFFFEQSLHRLGFLPDASSRRRWRVLLIAGGVGGVLASWLATGRLTFAALGLAAGAAAGLVVHLCWQPTTGGPGRPGLLAALTAAVAGHLIEIQFSFPVAVTHAYFWVYLGLFLAAARPEAGETVITGPCRRAVTHGLVVAVPMIVLAFGFLRAGGGFVFGLWLAVWGFGWAIMPAARTLRATGLYALASLGPAALWIGVQRLDFAAESFVLLLATVFVVVAVLAAGLGGGRPLGQLGRSWRYAPLVLAAAALIWLRNVDVVRADVALGKALESAAGRQWADALTLHEKAITLNAAEDRYHLALASTCQLAVEDREIREEARGVIWRRGEQAALEARRLNPYNPDNTANLGRYYFTAGAFPDAASFFEKTVALSPSNAAVRDMLAEVYEAMGRPREAASTRAEALRLAGDS